MGFNLDLDRQAAGRGVKQLVERHRRLVRRGPVAVTQPRMAQLAPLGLVRPSLKCCAGAQPRVVEQDQPSVGGQASVGFEAIDRTFESGLQRCSRRVRSGLAAEAMRIQRR